MEHAQTHSHSNVLTHVGRAFWIGIILNSAFVLIEFGAGIYTNSLALMSDAGHNLSDVISLALALFAYKIAKVKSSDRYTYGYRKATILVSLLNSIILLVAVGGIGWEAVRRFMQPESAHGSHIAMVAGVGIIINTVSAMLFVRDKEKDLNIKGAYLHLAVDALVSVGVVVAGIIIHYTNILWIDPLISIVIMVFVLFSTWSLLRESLKLSLDAVPHDIDIKEIEKAALQIDGIKGIHHIHVWAISTTQNALTAHILLDETLPITDIESIKDKLKHEFEHMNIHHVTLETEQKACSDFTHNEN